MTCWPWFSPDYRAIAEQAWAKAIIPSGCSADATGSIPCAPETMRARAEAWLAQNAPQALAQIGGSLPIDTYTFARYMHSEVGSGTIEERVAVGEAGANQARKRAGLTGSWIAKLRQMLLPNGMYGAIHAPDDYCASIGKPPRCNAANRWAATSRDPSVLSLLLAHLVISGASGDISNGAETQWGPDAFKFSDGSKIDSPAQAERFVRAVAAQGYYWVGPIAGVDPWHTYLVKSAPKLLTQAQPTIAHGASALPMTGSTMIHPGFADVSVCSRPVLSYLPPRGQTFLVSMLGLAAGSALALFVGRRYLHTA